MQVDSSAPAAVPATDVRTYTVERAVIKDGQVRSWVVVGEAEGRWPEDAVTALLGGDEWKPEGAYRSFRLASEDTPNGRYRLIEHGRFRSVREFSVSVMPVLDVQDWPQGADES